MKWVDSDGAERGELYYFVVKYKDSDKKLVKFYYPAKNTGVHHMTPDLWIQIVHTLEDEGIRLSWEMEKGSKFLDDNGFTYLD